MIIKINNRKIKFTDELLSDINRFKQSYLEDDEQGGMLIGSVILNTNDVVVDKVTYPMEGDFFNRVRFIRSLRHNRVLHNIWEKSNFTSMYVGEWHTHPQISPVPSSQDISNWKRLARKSNSDVDTFFFVIVGIEDIGIWYIDRNTLSIEKIYGGESS